MESVGNGVGSGQTGFGFRQPITVIANVDVREMIYA